MAEVRYCQVFMDDALGGPMVEEYSGTAPQPYC